jgi:hypothetical protein
MTGEGSLELSMSWPFLLITLDEESSGLTQPGQIMERLIVAGGPKYLGVES